MEAARPNYPWNAYIIRDGDGDAYQNLLNSMTKYPPPLIPCKLWYSDLSQKDINFLTAFAFINRQFFHLDELLEVLWDFNDNMTYRIEVKMESLFRRLGQNTPEGLELRKYYYAFDLEVGHVLNCNDEPRGPEGSIYGPPVGTRLFPGVEGQALVDACVGFEQQFLVDDGYDAAMAALPDVE